MHLQNERIEVLLSGRGGQGLLLAGLVLAYAAMKDDKRVVQSASYGPEARLGSSRSDVIISTRPIAYPKVISPNIVLLLSREAAKKYAPTIRGNAIVLYDSFTIHNPPKLKGNHIYPVPFTHIAIEKFGNPIVANMIALGFISKLTGIVSLKSLEEAIRERVKPGFVELDLMAMREGAKLAEKHEKEDP
ncbi:MAG: 2-oxoacid:ferredoxin oxidoreductase subunit gamma [Candidatus Hydrothermota bacterium]|nr:MAG: 2-oxoacid:ferredoxin oxidoreductase subunit gamma [Candidatus Hydrothermae bacterium]